METLSIIVPVFNEAQTVSTLLKRLESIDLGEVKKEVIVVDDGSSDGTRKILNEEFSKKFKVILHEKNQGKGSAIRTGIKNARGTYFIIQDADLEYDPEDIPRLLKVLREEGHDIVFGSRVLHRGKKQYSSLLFHLGGLLVTGVTNLLFRTKLSDQATCYKVFTRGVLERISPLECKGFEFCSEFTCKALNAGYKIKEIGIHYHPRSKKEGKKIKIKDGFIALWTLFKLKFYNHL